MFQQLPDRLGESTNPDSNFVIENSQQRLHHRGYWDKKIIRFSLALCILLPLGLFFPSASSGASLTYQTQETSQGNYDVIVYGGGLLQSKVYNLIFQNGPSNIISEIDVKQGQKVVQGQVLGRLNPGPLQDNLNLAYASVKVARANLNSVNEYANVARDFREAKIHSAWVTADAAQDNQNAVNEQSDTLRQVADAIIQDDQKILHAQRRASQILIEHARVLRRQTLETTCNVAQQTSTPALTPTVGITPTATVSLTPAASSSQTAFSMANQGNDNPGNNNPGNDNPGNDNPVNNVASDCVQQAETQYNLDVANAHVGVINAEEQVNKDQQELDQVQATIKVNNVNAQGQVDIAKSLINVARTDDDYASVLAQVTASQGQLFLALIQVNIARHNLANATLIAPHDGVVTGINGTIGGAPGVPSDNAITSSAAPSGVFIQLVDLSSPQQLIVNIAETDILKIKVGQTAQFTLKAFGYRPFTAHVEAISPNGVSNSGNIDYPAVMDIDAKSLHGLKPYPNMSANITLSVLHDRNVLMVPSSAIDFSHMMSTNVHPVVSQLQMQDAQHEADRMLSRMTQNKPDVAQQTLPPLATFVIEQAGNSSSQTFEARPVVLLGITNGASYEVLQGLTTGEHVVTGIDTAKKTP